MYQKNTHQKRLKYSFTREELVKLKKRFSIHLQKITSLEKIYLTKEQMTQYADYYLLLLLENAKINLTSIISPEEVATKHMLDSLLLLKILPLKDRKNIIDIGTGAGFPGLVLKIYQKNIHLTLLDSLNKRLVFTQKVATKLNLPHIEFLHQRAEDINKSQREKYDYVVTRAVAKLSTILSYSLPYLRKDGKIFAYKGPKYEEEMQEITNIIKEKSLKIDIKTFTLGQKNDQRAIVIIQK